MSSSGSSNAKGGSAYTENGKVSAAFARHLDREVPTGNDADSGGKVQQVRSYLEKSGFNVLSPAPAPAGMTTSEILFGAGSGQSRDESVVESFLPRFPTHYQAGATSGSVVIVVVGPDFPGLA